MESFALIFRFQEEYFLLATPVGVQSVTKQVINCLFILILQKMMKALYGNEKKRWTSSLSLESATIFLLHFNVIDVGFEI